MGTITSRTFYTRAGSGTISLTNASLPGGPTFEIYDVGTISSEFDLEEDSETASSVFFNLGELEFGCFDELSDNSSLFTTIDNNIGLNDEIAVEIDFTIGATSRNFVDQFVAQLADIEYNENNRSLTFSCKDVFESTDSAEDIIVNNPGKQVTANTATALEVNEFMDLVLAQINTNNSVINTAYFFSLDQKTLTPSKAATVIIESINKDSSKIVKASTMLYRLAAMSGSYVGSMMGYNFCADRSDTDGPTITNDDATLLDINFSPKNYFSMKGVFELRSVSGKASLLGTPDNLSVGSNKSFSVYFDLGPPTAAGYTAYAQGVEWNSTTSEYDTYSAPADILVSTNPVYVSVDAQEGDTVISIDDGSGGNAPSAFSNGDLVIPQGRRSLTYEVDSQDSNELALKEPLRESIEEDVRILKWRAFDHDSIVEHALDNYAYAYGANGARKIRIKVFGIDTIKPYEAFTLSSDFNSAVANKTFRPSKIEYDLKNDIIDIEGYQIA